MPSHSSAQRQTLDRDTVVLGHNGRPGPISNIVEEGSASARKLASAPRSTSSRQSHLIARSTVNQRRSIPPDRTKRPIGDKHYDGRGACSPMSAWSPLRAGQLTPDTRSIGLLEHPYLVVVRPYTEHVGVHTPHDKTTTFPALQRAKVATSNDLYCCNARLNVR